MKITTCSPTTVTSAVLEKKRLCGIHHNVIGLETINLPAKPLKERGEEASHGCRCSARSTRICHVGYRDIYGMHNAIPRRLGLTTATAKCISRVLYPTHSALIAGEKAVFFLRTKVLPNTLDDATFHRALSSSASWQKSKRSLSKKSRTWAFCLKYLTIYML
jgi:hypothetical protein